MDLFDERILTVLNDGKPRFFTQLLDEVGFSRNTLKLHLKRLTTQSLVMKEKKLSNGRGRPKYSYYVSLRARRQVSATLSDLSITIVTLPFSRLKHLCRFEKGGYCKQVRNKCDPGNCPQIPRRVLLTSHGIGIRVNYRGICSARFWHR
jgi:DNA-binding Lrp family transcriptional regulator